MKKKYSCVSDNDFMSILDKLNDSNLEGDDKEMISHMMKNYREIMLAILNGTYKGSALEKEINELRRELNKAKQKKQEENKPIDNELIQDDQDDTSNSKKEKTKPGKIKPKKKNPKKKQKGKKLGKRGHDKFKVTTEIKHDFDKDFIKEKYCPCCSKRESLYSLTPSIRVFFSGVSPISSECHMTQKARCSSCGVTISAQLPVEVENSVGRYLPSAVAQFAVTRFSLGFPHHRTEILTNLYELHIPDSNQWSAIETVAMEMEDLLTCLTINAANSKWIGFDDAGTRVVELKKEIKIELARAENEKKVRTGIQTTVFVTKTYSDHNIVLYMTGKNHQGENKSELLEYRSNPTPVIMMSDAAHKALMKTNLNKNVVTLETNCLEHLRIKCEEIQKNYPLETKYLLSEISKVYKNESYSKTECLDDLQRLAYHQTYSEPIMTDIKNYVEKELKENPRAEPNGDYARKLLNYTLNHWERLIGFLKYPGAEIDNNPTERKTKPVVRYRENSKKYLTEHGASIGDFYMSLIETCKLNHINPLEYLVFCITHRKLIADDPELFLPWNYSETKKEIEEELKNRPHYKIVSQRGAYIQKEETLRPQ